MAKSIKVLIAEDHDVVREGLKILISSDPGIQITGEARNGQTAVRLAKKLRPDVVLMDLAMPKGNGLEAARDICRLLPNSRVLVLSAYQDEDTVQRVVEAGASGYMTKHSAADELLTAIRQVGKGNSYYSPKIARRMKARHQLSLRARRNGSAPARLTPREQEVLTLIAQGQCSKEIAYNLELSIKTIEKHRQSVMDKLNIHEIAGLTRYATDRGLLTLAAQLRPVTTSARVST
ncbi:MAG TPA: response regulator transcription factor [Candidatus Binatia bacterium]|jgi:DNA-binding NarL/FixJ family response regulator|nr:response regulator transcription factor [Candidatus Binatia bacterium]